MARPILRAESCEELRIEYPLILALVVGLVASGVHALDLRPGDLLVTGELWADIAGPS